VKIVIASDSYKGALSSIDVANCIEKGINSYNKDYEIVKLSMADGGEGTVEALVEATKGHYRKVIVHDPLFRKVEATYGISGDKKTAFIEIAEASGLTLLNEKEKNPYVTSSYGTGQLICDALDRGCKNLIIGLGGSGTNDGGAGLLRALGAHFLDKNNKDLKEGGFYLSELEKIDTTNIHPLLKECKIKIASDVDNPLCGHNGASYIFGPQKGATKEMIVKLDEALSHYAKIIEKTVGINVANQKGAGAAGGMGIAFLGFTNAKIEKGIDIIIKETQFEKYLEDADLVITGEGSIDYQTRFGKTPYGIAQKAKEYDIPVIAIAGAVGKNADELYDYGFDSIFSIIDKPMTLEQAIKDSAILVERTAYRIIRTFMIRDDYKKRHKKTLKN